MMKKGLLVMMFLLCWIGFHPVIEAGNLLTVKNIKGHKGPQIIMENEYIRRNHQKFSL